MSFPVKFHHKTHRLCFTKVDTQAKHSTYQRRGGELDMDVAISAVASEFVSRFISFLVNKYSYSSHVRLEEKVERLPHLLMRVHTVVEEADGRYIMNSRMVMQLQLLSEAMYQGYSCWCRLSQRRFFSTLQLSQLKDSLKKTCMC